MSDLTERERRIRALAFDIGWDAATAFARPDLEHALRLAWDEGFTECASQHMRQRTDPNHPITRANPYSGEEA